MYRYLSCLAFYLLCVCLDVSYLHAGQMNSTDKNPPERFYPKDGGPIDIRGMGSPAVLRAKHAKDGWVDGELLNVVVIGKENDCGLGQVNKLRGAMPYATFETCPVRGQGDVGRVLGDTKTEGENRKPMKYYQPVVIGDLGDIDKEGRLSDYPKVPSRLREVAF